MGITFDIIVVIKRETVEEVMAFVAAEIAHNLAVPRAGELIDKMHPLLAEDLTVP